MQPIEEAKRILPLPQLMAKIGDGEHARKSAFCPFHENTQTEAFSVFQTPEGAWLWKCHTGCGHGDGVDYLEKRFGLSSGEAIARYCKEAGLNDGPQQNPQRHGQFDWQQCLEAMKEEGKREICEWRGYSTDFIDWLHREKVVGMYRGKFAFAVHKAGRVVGSHYLADRSKKLWFYEPKGNGTQPLTFGEIGEATYVLCCESQWDAFAIMDKLGWHANARHATAVFITRGSENGKLIKNKCAPQAIIYAFVQNDERKPDGSSAAEKWLTDLARCAGCKVMRVTTPGQHKDANDWTRAGASQEEIEEAIRAAKAVVRSEKPSRPELQPGAKEARDLLNDGRPKVQLPGDDYLLSDTANDVGKILAPQNIFTRGGFVFTLEKGGDRLTLMKPATLRTWMEEHLIPYKATKRGATERLIAINRTISESDAKGILASPQFTKHLRPIERLNPIRMPVMRRDGSIELLPEGYDRQTKSFTHDSVQIDAGMPTVEAKRIIDQLFGEFVFADKSRSKAVGLGAMLTVYGRGLLPQNSLRPCFMYLANAEGAGKGLLVKCAVVPVLGYAPIGTKPKDEDEMRKTLHTAVLEARPVILFDNIKGHLSSAALEGFLTAQHCDGRILGESKSFLGENNAVVFITGNSCTVSPDMRRRSLFSELFLEVERAEDRIFKQNLEAPFLLEHRAEILSAHWSFIQHWHQAGQPPASRNNSSFSEWSSIIGGIVEKAGYGCALETAQIESAADTDLADMRALVKSIADGSNLKQVAFEEMVEAARGGGLFSRIIAEGQDLDARAKATLAALLKRYDRRLIGGYRFTLLGKGRSRRFQVEENRQ